jgi:hypothetical protein
MKFERGNTIGKTGRAKVETKPESPAPEGEAIRRPEGDPLRHEPRRIVAQVERPAAPSWKVSKGTPTTWSVSIPRMAT